MSNGKLKLSEDLLSRLGSSDPAQAVGANQTEVLKTQRAGIDAGAKVEVAKLQVAKEAIEAIKGALEVVKSHNQLKATRVEWQGRITEAEIAVKKAEVNLQVTRETNQVRAEELTQSRLVLDRVLELFDLTMAELKTSNCSESERKNLRLELLEISDRLVIFKK
jgi:multidrug resistance efflux pump